MNLKIINENKLTYGAIEPGNIFKINSEYYICTDRVNGAHPPQYYSVNLSNGNVNFFSDDEPIKLVAAELYVNG